MNVTPQPPVSSRLARSIVESLKAGTVPDVGAEYFTAGRERWLGSLRVNLDDVGEGDARLRIFNGRYGDGKTHLMRLLRDMALQADFVVAYVSISKEVPLSNWSLVYQAIVRSLQTQGSGDRMGLGVIIDPNRPDPLVGERLPQLAEGLRSLTHLHPDFLTAVYRYSTAQGVSVDTDADLLNLRNWFEGQPVPKSVLTPLGISSPVARQDGPRLLASLVGVLHHLGFAGVVVLLDEVESTMQQRTAQGRSAAYDNLRQFIDRSDLPDHTLAIFSTTPEMFSDPERGFQSYAALWSRISSIGPSGTVDYRATVCDLTATPLEERDFESIGERIRQLHETAYSWNSRPRVPQTFVTAAAELAAKGRLGLVVSPTRIFVKLVADELDLANQHEDHIADASDLRRRFVAIGDQLMPEAEQWS